LQEPLTWLVAVSKLADMPKEDGTRDDGPYRTATLASELEKLRAEIVSLVERNANQVKAMNHGALLLQAAREERDQATQTLRAARSDMEDLRQAFDARDKLTAVAVAEFGAQVEHFRREAKERDETRLHLTAIKNGLSNDNDDLRRDSERLRSEVERLRAEVRRLGDFPAEVGPYRTGVVEEVHACNDRLNRENETLAHKVVDANEARDRAQNETARLTERWTKLGTRLAGMRRATNALAREVGVLRQKIAQDDNFHGLWLGGVDGAIAEALAASQEAEGT